MTTPTPGSRPTPGPREPGDRGGLDIAAQVVEKIAAAAAGEVEHVGDAARRVLGVATGSDAVAARPRVDAHVDGRTVTVDVTCSIGYPAPVATVTDRLRSHLGARIEALTGLRTCRVDVTVAALTTATVAPKGRVL